MSFWDEGGISPWTRTMTTTGMATGLARSTFSGWVKWSCGTRQGPAAVSIGGHPLDKARIPTAHPPETRLLYSAQNFLESRQARALI
jgi:hypothetical protein